MTHKEMTVIECHGAGSPDVMALGKRPMPEPKEREVLIVVAAAGINRADILQRQGKYPPPRGASEILGLEISGIIAAVGIDVKRWHKGDKVCALLSGGGYAEYATVPEIHCLPVPYQLDLIEAAALPEAMVTVYANLFQAGNLQSGKTALIHGGSSGIGTTAIQMAKLRGATVIVTVGSAEKMEACYSLGADFVINYNDEDYVEAALRATNRRGVEVVLDMIGGTYVNRNLQALAPYGSHISIAAQKAGLAPIDMRLIMQKRLIVTGSTLRDRPDLEKAQFIARIETDFWPFVAAGAIKPVIFQRFPLKNASEAHKVMENGSHIGKMVLEVS